MNDRPISGSDLPGESRRRRKPGSGSRCSLKLLAHFRLRQATLRGRPGQLRDLLGMASTSLPLDGLGNRAESNLAKQQAVVSESPRGRADVLSKGLRCAAVWPANFASRLLNLYCLSMASEFQFMAHKQ